MRYRCSWLPETGHVCTIGSQDGTGSSAPADALHVETGLIRGAVHYVVEDQPEAVAGLIERYATL